METVTFHTNQFHVRWNPSGQGRGRDGHTCARVRHRYRLTHLRASHVLLSQVIRSVYLRKSEMSLLLLYFLQHVKHSFTLTIIITWFCSLISYPSHCTCIYGGSNPERSLSVLYYPDSRRYKCSSFRVKIYNNSGFTPPPPHTHSHGTGS